MFRQPSSHKPYLWSRQRSPENFTGMNVKTGLVISTLGVEVRRRMVVPVHVDDDPIELADPWHPRIVWKKVIRVGRTV